MDEDQIYRDALGRFRTDTEKRQEQQEQQRRAAENELLDSATNMREFIERREAIPHLVLQPELPADEMSMGDYLKLRDPQRWYGWTHETYSQAVKGNK
jgi:hypothetical protein